MKRYYLYNAFYLLLAILIIAFWKKDGFFTAIIMRQDIIHFVVALPVYLSIGIFGIAYQIFKVDLKDKKNLWWRVLSITTTLYIMFCLFFLQRIHLTTSSGLEAFLFVLPAISILISLLGTLLPSIKQTIKRLRL